MVGALTRWVPTVVNVMATLFLIPKAQAASVTNLHFSVTVT